MSNLPRRADEDSPSTPPAASPVQSRKSSAMATATPSTPNRKTSITATPQSTPKRKSSITGTPKSTPKRKASPGTHTPRKKSLVLGNSLPIHRKPTEDALKFLEGAAGSINDNKAYQDVFKTEQESIDRLNHAGETIKYYTLNITDDDVDRLDEEIMRNARSALFNALLEPPEKAPGDMDDKAKAWMNKKHDERFEKVKGLMSKKEGLIDASACVDVLVRTVKNIHTEGIPLGAIKLDGKKDIQEAKNVRLKHCNFVVDKTTPCLSRLTAMVDYLRRNKYIANDLLLSRGGAECLAFACSPKKYYDLKLTNAYGQYKKSLVLAAQNEKKAGVEGDADEEMDAQKE